MASDLWCWGLWQIGAHSSVFHFDFGPWTFLAGGFNSSSARKKWNHESWSNFKGWFHEGTCEPPLKLIVYAWNQNTGYRFFWALSLYSVLYKSTLNNIHKCNGIDFHQRFPRPASSNISVQRHVFFLWESFISCSCCLFVILEKGANGIKWVYPSSGIPLLTKGYREVLAEVITNLKHLDDQEMISWGTWKKEEPFNIPWTSLDNTHMATARNTGTACWIFFNFAHCVTLHNNALSLDMVFLTTTGPCSLPQII